MRVAPIWMEKQADKSRKQGLALTVVFWPLIVSGVAATFTNPAIRRAATSARATASAVVTDPFLTKAGSAGVNPLLPLR